MKKVFAVISLLALVGAALWLWLGPSDSPPEEGGRASASAARSEAVRTPINSLLEAPLPPPKGTLTIRGTVAGAQGPVAGAIVVATADGGDEVLSELVCGCDNKCGRKLLECGCPQAAAQMVELVLERRGEAPPIARATSGADGTFAIEGIEAGVFALWAEKPGAQIGVKRGVSAGSENVEVRVDAGMMLHGKAVDDDKKPVANAAVTAIFAEHSRFFDAASGADGSFTIGPVPMGKHRVVASKAGFLPAEESVDADGNLNDLQLNTPRRLTGRVLREEQPVKGALVRCEGGHRKLKIETDEQGRFSFDGLRPLEYELTASEGLSYARREVRIEPGKDVLDLELRIETGGEVVGLVLGAGKPINDAEITARSMEEHSYQRVTGKSGSDGRFRVGPLAPGKYRIHVSAEKFLAPSSREVEVLRSGSANADFTLEPAALVRGTVVDPDGKPVEGAWVGASEPNGNRADEIGENPHRSSSARTHGDGTFEIDGLLPGSYELAVNHKDFLVARHKVSAPSSDSRVTLERGLEIEGIVVDEAERPQAGVKVSAGPSKAEEKADGFRRDERGDGWRDATSGPDGTFRIRGLEAGRHHVVARLARDPRKGGSFRLARAETVVHKGAPATVRLKFPVGLSIRGTVTGSDGSPVAEVMVRAMPDRDRLDKKAILEGAEVPMPGSAMSQADGSFAIDYLAAGSYRLIAHKEGMTTSDEVEAKAGDEGVKLVMSVQPKIRGRVVLEDGSPVKHFKLNRRELHTDDGRFAELFYAREGSVELLVEAEGLAPISRKFPESKQDIEAGDIVLVGGRTLRGTVLDAKTGAPVEGALVDVGDEEPKHPEHTYLAIEAGAVRSGADGSFALPRVDNRRSLTVFAQHPGHRLAWQPLAPTDDGIVIRMRKGGAVAGRVTDGAGKPIPASLMVRVGEATQTAEAGADGTFMVAGLPSGRGWVLARVMMPGAAGSRPRFMPKAVEVPEEGEVRVELAPLSGGAHLMLRNPGDRRMFFVLLPGDVPMPAKPEDMRESWSAGFPGEPGPQDTEFQHVPAGSYTLFGVEPGGRKAMRLFRQPVVVSAEPEQRIEVRIPENLTEIAVPGGGL